jgi:hypothetical protein
MDGSYAEWIFIPDPVLPKCKTLTLAFHHVFVASHEIQHHTTSEFIDQNHHKQAPTWNSVVVTTTSA